MIDNNYIERELGWDEVIEKDSDDFLLLEAGDYDFVVTAFERGRHNGSEKLPPCNKAVLSLRFDSPKGSVTLQSNLFLHTKTEGLLSSFFASIGQKKKGEKLQMNWNSVIGSRGRAKIGIRDWKSKTGQDMQSNEIVKFYSKEEAPKQAGFTAGRF